jgi:Fibronectin type III domain/NHL repeat
MRSEVAARSGRRRTRHMSGGVAVAALAIVLSAGLAFPQAAGAAGTGTISTIAGSDPFGDFTGDGGPATAAALNDPSGVAVMPDGGYLIADAGNDRVRRVFPDGTINTVAGTGTYGFSGDGGPATAAALQAPIGVAVMPDGGFVIADAAAARVRRVSPTGIITTVAGTGTRGISGDGGPATAAQIYDPQGVAAMPDGGFLIADGDYVVRRVSPTGIITTVAGTGVQGSSGDGGPATAAQLNVPNAVAVTADGGFLIADTGNAAIRLVDAGFATAVPPSATTVPAAPTIGSATFGNASATARWTAPSNDGGSAITGYLVRVLDSAGVQVGALRPAAASATSLVISGLTNGSSYQFQVAATNAVGTGPNSALSAVVIPATVPGAPVIGTAASGTAGGAVTATANWNAPTINGGSAITGYVVRALRLSATGTVLATTKSAVQPSSARQLTMTLQTGNYRFTVQAINKAGSSPQSARSNLVVAQ